MNYFNKGNTVKGQTKMGKMKLDNDSNIETRLMTLMMKHHNKN